MPRMHGLSSWCMGSPYCRSFHSGGARGAVVAGRHADPSLHETPCAPLRSVMLVGLGGNNGTTLLAGVLANKQ